MRCSVCGTVNATEARFCANCGASLVREEAPTPVPEDTLPAAAAVPEVPAEPPPRYGAGARVALIRGALAFVIVLLLGVVVFSIAPPDGIGVNGVLKGGGFQFHGFHRVAIQVDLPTIDLGEFQEAGEQPMPFDFGLNLSIAASLAAMLGTALAVWLLYRGGRAVAVAAGGRPWQGLLLGPAVALPYAVLSLILSFVAVFHFEIPGDVPLLGGEEIRIAASPIGALLWPLLIGAVAALAGGFGVVRDGIFPPAHGRRVLAALGGGGRMLLWALAVCFVGLFVLSATNPDIFTGYFEFVGGLPTRDGISFIVSTALVVPNMMAGFLFVGMGASLVAAAVFGPLSFSVVLSLLRWPQEFDASAFEQVDPFAAAGGAPQVPVTYGIGPWDWFFFVLAPLVPVILGGRWAARRAGERSAAGAAAVGALAGVPFALGCLALSILATISVQVTHNIPFLAGGLVRFGPSILLGTLIALAWGTVGGALGGAILGRSPGLPPPEASPQGPEPEPATTAEASPGQEDEPPTPPSAPASY